MNNKNIILILLSFLELIISFKNKFYLKKIYYYNNFLLDSLNSYELYNENENKNLTFNNLKHSNFTQISKKYKKKDDAALLPKEDLPKTKLIWDNRKNM
jgi:hypothetical protein